MRDRRQEIFESVVSGDEGFLFHRFDYTFEQICGQFNLSDSQLERWCSLIEARHAWCAARQIQYVFMVVPEKHVIYDDKLPGGERVSPNRPALQIQGSLAQTMAQDFLYPEDVLREGRAKEEVYFRKDVHWNNYGAYLGYRALLDRLPTAQAPGPIPESELVRRKYSKIGDLAIRIDTAPREEAFSAAHPRADRVRKIFGNRGWGPGQVEVFESGNDRLPRCVLFRDSCATGFMHYLGSHFSRLAVVATDVFFHDLIRHERPAVVITEMHERVLARATELGVSDAILFPDDFGATRFTAFTGVSLPLRTEADLTLVFGGEGNGVGFLRKGWSHPETQFTWAVGTESLIEFPQQLEASDYVMELDLAPALALPHVAAQELKVAVNGVDVGTFSIVGTDSSITCEVPAACLNASPTLSIRLLHPGCIRPKDYGHNEDVRELSVALSRIRLRKAV